MNVQMPDKMLRLFIAQSLRKGISFDDYLRDLHLQLADRIQSQEGFFLSIEDKIATSEHVLTELFSQVESMQSVSLAWTGGKDSTLLLWLVKRVIDHNKLSWPKVVLIDEGDMFEEVEVFCKDIARDWKFDFVSIRNEDVLSKAKSIGQTIQIKQLNKRNLRELERLGYAEKTWKFEPESEVGNHLMKTVVQNVYLEQEHIKFLITGIRWDEQIARENELYFSKRADRFTPTHTRVHPILHFTEKDVWDAIKTHDIPHVSLYDQGYRSLGAKSSTDKSGTKPAWEQDLEHTTERSGRAQDKEQVMERLRKLGYM